MFLAQDYENKQLLIINDCPGQIFEGDFPQVRIINCKDRFPSLGEKRNFAIREAEGDWIAVWDDDDVYLPWRLSHSMQEIAAYETRFYLPYQYWAYWGDEHLHQNEAIPGWISHPVAVFHRELWKAAGGYPPITFKEDAGLFQKMLRILRTDWLNYPISEADRFMIMRGKSPHCHTSIQGGQMPPDTTPGTILLSPRQIQDDVLRNAAESLMTKAFPNDQQSRSRNGL